MAQFVELTAVESMALRVRRLRKARRLTLSALAKRCGVAPAEIRDLETGRVADPELLLGMRLAEALHVDAEYLAFGMRLNILHAR